MPDEHTLPRHPDEDLLEQYVLSRLNPQQLAWVEEHLLLCTSCQEAVEETEAFIEATRRASAELPQRSRKPSKGWMSSMALPYRAASVAVAALLIVVTTLTWRRTESPQLVDLAALRGSSAAVATANSHAPVRLNLEIPESSAATAYTVEVVDARGIVTWDQRDVYAQGSQLSATLPRALGPGQYFVRVYANSLKNDLLKEYSLVVR